MGETHAEKYAVIEATFNFGMAAYSIRFVKDSLDHTDSAANELRKVMQHIKDNEEYCRSLPDLDGTPSMEVVDKALLFLSEGIVLDLAEQHKNNIEFYNESGKHILLLLEAWLKALEEQDA